MRQSTLSLLLVILIATPVSVVAQQTSDGYEIQAEPSIDTPESMVSLSGAEYEMSSIGRAHAGESLTISTSVRSNVAYDLYLFDSERRIIATHAMEGDGTWTIDTSSYDPGSYVVAIYGTDGQFKDIQPLVIADYRASLQAPSTVSPSSPMAIEVRTAPITGSQDISSVEVVLSNGDVTRRVEATKSSEGTYTAQVTTDVPPGEYGIYAVVRGESAYQGRKEPIGISDRSRISIVSQDTTADEAGTGDNQQTTSTTVAAGGSEDGDRAQRTSSQATTPESIVTQEERTTSEETPATTTITPEKQSTSTQTPNSVVTLNPEKGSKSASSSPEPTTSGTMPDHSPWALIALLLVSAAVLKIRNESH